MREERTRILIEVALVMALAAVLNVLKVWHMPQGGSVSFVLLPLLVLALRRGLRVGLMAGALYGVVDFMVDPFVVHWVQFLLDYSVAYGLVGLAGAFSPAWNRAVESGGIVRALWTVVLPAIVVAVLGRYAAHVVSGVVFFSEYAGDQPALLYSLVYNLYVPVSGVLAFVGAGTILPVLENVFPVSRAVEA
jgi:thiamine transporter